jgi:hypothetical protein
VVATHSHNIQEVIVKTLDSREIEKHRHMRCNTKSDLVYFPTQEKLNST